MQALLNDPGAGRDGLECSGAAAGAQTLIDTRREMATRHGTTLRMETRTNPAGTSAVFAVVEVPCAMPDCSGRARGSRAILTVLSSASLATLGYIGVVAVIAPDLALAWPLLAVFFAAVVSSIAGFAFAPICAVMLVHLVDDPVRLVATIMMASIMIQVFVVTTLWREIDWAGTLVALAGGLSTLPLGVLLLLAMTGRAPVLVLATTLIAYALWMLWRPHVAESIARPRWADAMVGAAGGITGGFAGFPAGPLVAWFAWCGVGRVACRGIVQPYILIMQVAALLILYGMAPTAEAVPSFDLTLLLVAAPALFGTICGLQICGRLSDRIFSRAVNVTLLCAGLAMLT